MIIRDGSRQKDIKKIFSKVIVAFVKTKMKRTNMRIQKTKKMKRSINIKMEKSKKMLKRTTMKTEKSKLMKKKKSSIQEIVLFKQQPQIWWWIKLFYFLKFFNLENSNNFLRFLFLKRHLRESCSEKTFEKTLRALLYMSTTHLILEILSSNLLHSLNNRARDSVSSF